MVVQDGHDRRRVSAGRRKKPSVPPRSVAGRSQTRELTARLGSRTTNKGALRGDPPSRLAADEARASKRRGRGVSSP